MELGRAIGRAVLRKLAPFDMSLSSMIRAARAEGGGYDNTEMLNDARMFTGRIKNEYHIRQLNTNEFVSKEYMVETRLSQPTKYRVHGMATFWDEESGTPYEQRVSFFTDDYAKLEEYEQGYFDTFSGTYKEQMLDPISYETRVIEHNIGYGY